MGVELVHWNPRRPISPNRIARLLPIRRPVDNFGDLLGPRIVARIVQQRGLMEPDAHRRLVSVGSVLHLTRAGDVIWGTGVNGKSLDKPLESQDLDVRAVRGPRTRAFLHERGIGAPDVYGDPGLLLGHLWTREELAGDAGPHELAVVPNLHDWHALRHRAHVVNPRDQVDRVLRRIASARLVVGSSLHGVVVAESLGIPARLVASSTEPRFKYDDYYEGSGRSGIEIADDVDEALRMGGAAGPSWDPRVLLDAFPEDLWRRASS